MLAIKKILVPLDLTEKSVKVVKTAVYFAEKLKARLDLIFVAEDFEAYSGLAVPHVSLPGLAAELKKSAKRKMETFIEDNLPPALPCTSRILQGDIARQIIEYAAAENCDLIIMGTQACRGMDRAIFGSVAQQVIKTASCPVLTLNPCT